MYKKLVRYLKNDKWNIDTTRFDLVEISILFQRVIIDKDEKDNDLIKGHDMM